ncbi:MAG: LURP-one-related family protein [Methanomassiliicoccaceae archaeon]|nr:LURP-one-related family protein [Methanomassiliicoccaceae archaeon]
MILTQKQKIVSWFDSYNIYDDKDNIVFKVKGKLAWGHKLEIYDSNDKYLGKVVEKVISLLPKYIFFVGESEIGFLQKKLSLMRPKFELECAGWKIDGNVMQWNYNVMSGNELIMTCDKKVVSLRDTYKLNIIDEKNALLCLMISLSIDIDKCSAKKK